MDKTSTVYPEAFAVAAARRVLGADWPTRTHPARLRAQQEHDDASRTALQAFAREILASADSDRAVQALPRWEPTP